MKINIYTDSVDMIHKEIKAGAYGTKYGIDGCLYSIPGDGNCILCYDVVSDEVKVISELRNPSRAKYAGGFVDHKGNIYAVPATANDLFHLDSNCDIGIPLKIYNKFFVDNY